MKPRDASITAQTVAAHHEAELWLPKTQRICDDLYAPAFVEPGFTLIGKSRIPKKLALWLHQQALPGLHNALVARGRHGDEYLQQGLKEGIMQIAILGAGYDTRAYRFAQAAPDVKFFEVDHPVTQAIKQAKSKQLFGALSPQVVYVPVDFTTQRLDALLKSGYDVSRKALFLWEGVTYYIPREAVEQTLWFIASHAAAGSRILFDFFPPSVITGTSPLKEAKKLRAVLAKASEPLLFGMETYEMPLFLSQFGFQDIQILKARDIHQLYFTGANAKRYVSDMFSFVQATVKTEIMR